MSALLSPLNIAVGLAVAVAAAVLSAVWLLAVAGTAYAALVFITYVSTPSWAADTRDRTREHPRRDRAPGHRSFGA